MSLRELLEAAAAETDATASADPDGALVWTRGSVAFATLDGAGATATFRLDPVLAAAAARTPDTRPGEAGPGWVSFRPAVLDGHAEDRARAWFAAAHRRAGDAA